MTADVVVTKGLSNFGHMAGCALASGTGLGVVRVLANSSAETGWVASRVAGKTKRISSDRKIRRITVAVDLVAIEAAEAAVVHHALREVVALHPVFMRARVLPEIEVL